MKTKLGKKIERLAGTCPRRECPHCKYKFERVSRYCNMCGRPLKAGKEMKSIPIRNGNSGDAAK